MSPDPWEAAVFELIEAVEKLMRLEEMTTLKDWDAVKAALAKLKEVS